MGRFITWELGISGDPEIRRFGNPLNNCGEENLHSEGTEPCDEALEADDEDGPFLTEFATDRSDGCYTWSVEEAEDKQYVAGDLVKDGKYLIIGREEDSKSRNNALLCHKSGYECCYPSPVAKSEWGEEWRQNACYRSKYTVGCVAHESEMPVEMLKEPDDDAGKEDDREGTLHEVACFLPHELESIAKSRHSVAWKFHDEWYGFTLKETSLEEECHKYACYDSEEIE